MRPGLPRRRADVIEAAAAWSFPFSRLTDSKVDTDA